MTRWSNTEFDKAYQACHCLHVRVGTILLAAYKVLTQLAILCLLIAVLINPNIFPKDEDKEQVDFSISMVTFGQQEGIFFKHDHRSYLYEEQRRRNGNKHLMDSQADSDYMKGDRFNPTDTNVVDGTNKGQKSVLDQLFGSPERSNRRKTQKSNDDESEDFGTAAKKNSSTGNVSKRRREDGFAAVAVTLFWLSFSLFLLTGSLTGRPSYLMPFFCLQVFDFVITCLNVVGYFTYLPDIRRWISERPGIPHKRFLLSLDPACLTFLLMSICIGALLIKTYLLGMVWSCYKFLARRATGLESGTGFGPSPIMARFLLRTSPVWFTFRHGYVIMRATIRRSNSWERQPDVHAEYEQLRERLENLASSRRSTGRSCRDTGALFSDVEQSEVPAPPPPPPPFPGTSADTDTNHPEACPPKYEEVLKTPANAYMPPPYYRGKFDESE